MFIILEKAIVIFILGVMIFCIIGTVRFLLDFWKRYEDKRYFVYSFMVASIICVLGYGCLVASKHYSVDSFNLYFDMSPFWHVSIGRYINGSVILFAQEFGVNQVASQCVFMVIWIVTLVFMQIMIAESISRYIKSITLEKRILVLLSVLVSFINVFAMELMLFTEMAMVFIPGNLALGLAIYTVLCSQNDLKKWFICAFYLFIALGSYQSYIGIFEAFVLIGIFFKYQKNTRERYQESLIALLLGAGEAAFNVLHVRVLVDLGVIGDSGRGAALSIASIIENIQGLIKYQIRFWKNADGIVLPMVMPILGIFLVYLVLCSIRRIEKIEQKIFLLTLLAGCYILGVAPHIIEKVQILSPRSNIAVWSVISIIFIIGIQFLFDIKKAYRRALCISVGIVLLSNIYSMTDMAANAQAMNAIDLLEAELIAGKVLEYQKNTSNIVTKVGVSGDVNITYYRPESRYHNCELGGRIMSTFYSNYRLIGYMLGRSLQKVDIPENVYKEYFDGKDWTMLNVDEQVVCVGDALYLVIY